MKTIPFLALLVLAFTAPAFAQLTLVETGGTFRTDATNLAFAATAASGGDYGPPHVFGNINNGTYGNSSSWLGPGLSNFGFIGLGFSTPVTIGSLAFGRDNTGTYTDRTFGTYEIEYSRNHVSGSGLMTGTWQVLHILDYAVAPPTDPHLRHLYNLDTPLTGITGIRITVPAFMHSASFESGYQALAIDEFEIYATSASAIPEPSTYAALFGIGALALAIYRKRRAAA
jgi:hypothetical protein